MRIAMELKPGVQVASRYRIERVLADDRGGTVLLTREAQNGLIVALKVLPKSVPQEKLISRFRRVMSIDSPHVPKLFELGGLDDGRAFVAMEYLNGSPLKDRVTEGPLSLGDTIVAARQLCLALDAAHKANVVHRRLATAKLFDAKRGSDRSIQVLGFATGAAVDEGPDASADYLAPEQLAGENGERSADIWAAGVIIYELLTGRLPFAGITRRAVVKRVGREDPKPPRSIRAEIPWQLEQVVLRCLDKNPATRIESAEALSKELDQFVGAITEAPRKASAPPAGVAVAALAVSTPSEAMNVAKLSHVLGGDANTPAGFHRLRSDGQIIGMKFDEVADLARAKRIEGEASRLQSDASERSKNSARDASLPPRSPSLPPRGMSLPPSGTKTSSRAAPPPTQSIAPERRRGSFSTGNLVVMLIVAAVLLGLGSGLIVRTFLQ